ncbi:hypothetical protein OEZ85_012898 [Tetradesmus obliquus]|uniref:P-loop containing nucleoside triphosphate hydrolase protein n=1 Tax=Tetradesmus obliquus TaxID=3088 RepID=A0ABY8U4A2_TETOB|nr:hypothetical protein OEZ85_012898 [Tetradesmus obliquus]
MGLPEQLLAALKAQKFSAPTPVQAAAQQAVLSGRNVALQSATGTGKTLAYLLPLLSELQPCLPGKQHPPRHGRVLVICPTQELCMQVLRAARALLPGFSSKVQPLVGGANPFRQLEALKQHKPCIVVATPGRLLKVITKGGAFDAAFPYAASSSASSSRDKRMVLVLEEADKLLVMSDTIQADKLLVMSDTIQVFRLLAALQANDQRTVQNYGSRKHKSPRSQHNIDMDLEQHGRYINTGSQFEVSDDADADVDRGGGGSKPGDPIRTVLNSYQVLLVSAGLKPSTLAAAPAWTATQPIMIAAAPSAAAAAAAAVMPASSSSGDAGKQQELAAAYASGDSEVYNRADRHLMLPEHIQHQVLLYASDRHDAVDKHLTRCLNTYLDKGCKALVFVGQRQNVWALQLRLQRSRQLHAELGALHSGLEPQQKANLLRRFNSGKLRALLLTDAFGLGLDFQEVDVVLSVESLPAGQQQYIRRAGRTGRMGRPGTVLSVIPKERLTALKIMVKRLKVELTEVALREQAASSGGGWLIEPKHTAEAVLAGKGRERRRQQQQQQQQWRPSAASDRRSSGSSSSGSSSSGSSSSGSSPRLSRASRESLFGGWRPTWRLSGSQE